MALQHWRDPFFTSMIMGGRVILLTEEILDQLIGRSSHHLQDFIHPKWCMISSINRTCFPFQGFLGSF